ncbi:MAG: restriction endonuclease, partial [Bacteroidales bacterium]|nr:restriction endonuclease [Bacteroidales bacterium]
TVIRNGIKFCQYVGVIQIGNLTIEILPKADKQSITKHDYDSETRRWQKVLLKMLAISGEIDLETVSEASLRKRFTLLDLYFEVYLQEVDTLLRRGLTKKYRQNEGNVKALKGRLNFSRDIQRNCIHRERFYTCHQSYDHEHLINQILLKGINILDVLSSGSMLNDKIRKLMFYFPEIREITINKDSFNKIRLTRKTREYTKALAIAKMLILNFSPDISMGDENMLALLFDMNKLWEKYIYKQLKAREDENLRVMYQVHDLFWESKSIYPDIVIERKKATAIGESTDDNRWEPCIIDTKWKLIDVNKPSDDDLKQMYVYNMYWNSSKSMLLYPKLASSEDSGFGKFHKGRSGDNHCKIGFVSVLDDSGEFNQGVANEILDKIELE